MAGFNYPWSGDVTQAINPWELWIRSISSQMGFINIRNVNSGDAAIEQEVVETVASYGRQLGRINDALATLIDKPNLDNLTDKERAAIADFRDMVAAIEVVKQRRKSPARLLAALDAVLEGIDELKSENTEVYETAVRRIREKLGPPQIAGPKKTAKLAG